jgi:S1-C subfamily serine protease
MGRLLRSTALAGTILAAVAAGCGSSGSPANSFILAAPPSGAAAATATPAAPTPAPTTSPAPATPAATASAAPVTLPPAATDSPTPSDSSAPAATDSAAPSASDSSAPSASSAPSGSAPALGSALPGAVAAQLQQAYIDVVKKVGPSVVVIETSEGLGSGVVFDDKGNIVTNAHVVGSSTTFKVTASDGKQYTGRLVGTFVPGDIAVINVPAASGLHPATFGDSSKLIVGDIVLAIGNPLGLQSSVTEGIVSALGRTVSEPGGAALPGTIQTSAPINPGNSGGALVNLDSEVIGIPTLAASDPQLGGSAPGIGFAIPSNQAKDIAQQLISSGHVTNSHRAYIGIRAADLQGAPGTYVYSVDSGGPAAKAGIEANDIILSIGGKATPDSNTLSEVLAGFAPGDKVKVEILKPDGTQSTVDVTLGELPG